MANQVTLTFAGDSANLERSFDNVGGSAKKMSDQVEQSGEGFRKAGESADELDTKAMGFRDTMTGVEDTLGGVAAISKGQVFDGFLMLGAGVGDLASGFYNLLIPAMSSAVTWFKATALGQKAAAVGARIWTAAQWLMNASLWASPVTWIVVGIIALIAVIVLIATKTDWFQKAWSASWKWVKQAAQNTWEFIKKIPGWIGSAFSKVASFITAPYRSAFNMIARAWNATIGRLSWTVPSWIPGIGGNSISVPHLPQFHSGGVVPGIAGTPTVALLQAGERVNSMASAGSGGGALEIRGDGTALADGLLEVLSKAIRRRGGDGAAVGIRTVSGATS